MNKKIAKTLITLICVYLVAFYIIKIFFPQLILDQVVSDNVLIFGNFIQERAWLNYLIAFATTLFTYYLFACASSGMFKKNWKQIIFLIIFSIVDFAAVEFLPNFAQHISTSLMLIYTLICNGKMFNTIITFVIHGACSQLLFMIKGFETVIMRLNVASALMLSVEGFAWLLLLSILFNLKRR